VKFYFVLRPYEVPSDDIGAYDVSPIPFCSICYLSAYRRWLVSAKWFGLLFLKDEKR